MFISTPSEGFQVAIILIHHFMNKNKNKKGNKFWKENIFVIISIYIKKSETENDAILKIIFTAFTT